MKANRLVYPLVVIVVSAVLALTAMKQKETFVATPATPTMMHPYTFMTTLFIASTLTLVCTIGYVMFVTSS